MLNRARVEQLLSDFKKLKIVVIGDIMLDRYIWGRVQRISPEAPVPVVEMTHEVDRPGGAGNVVLNLTSLGASCYPLSIIGDDRCGASLREQLRKGGADIGGLVSMPSRPTAVKTRVIADDQHVVRVDREITSEFPHDLVEKLLGNLSDIITETDAVILQDYNKGVMSRTVIREAIDMAHKHDIPVTVDPKFKNFFEYWGATVFKPNLREAENAMGRPLVRNEDVERAGKELLARLQAHNVLITRGAKGMSLFENTRKPIHIPTRAVTIHDVSGAGDTVISTLTLGIAAGLDGVEAAELANYAAECVVSRVGVVPVTREALLAAIEV